MELVSTFFEGPALLCRPAHEVFRISRIMLNDIELWSQWSRARDENGRPCKPHDPRARQWSVTGVLALSSNPLGISPPSLISLLDYIVREWGLVSMLYRDEESGWEMWESADDFNDSRPHRFILALLDEAIARTATL